jgi:hypothetical protein
MVGHWNKILPGSGGDPDAQPPGLSVDSNFGGWKKKKKKIEKCNSLKTMEQIVPFLVSAGMVLHN